MKKLITKKFAEKWMKENADFMADYRKIVEKIVLFKMMWGVEIGIILKNPEENKGRELGKGLVEELFNAQTITNKSK